MERRSSVEPRLTRRRPTWSEWQEVLEGSESGPRFAVLERAALGRVHEELWIEQNDRVIEDVRTPCIVISHPAFAFSTTRDTTVGSTGRRQLQKPESRVDGDIEIV